MAYEDLGKYQNTKNYSQRNIDQKFNLVEFNRIFEQNNLNLSKNNNLQDKPECPKKKDDNPNILFIITCCLIILGILLLLFNNFILVGERKEEEEYEEDYNQ